MYSPPPADPEKVEKALLLTQVIQAAYAVERSANHMIYSPSKGISVPRGAERVSNQTFACWLKAVDAHVQYIETNRLPLHGT